MVCFVYLHINNPNHLQQTWKNPLYLGSDTFKREIQDIEHVSRKDPVGNGPRLRWRNQVKLEVQIYKFSFIAGTQQKSPNPEAGKKSENQNKAAKLTGHRQKPKQATARHRRAMWGMNVGHEVVQQPAGQRWMSRSNLYWVRDWCRGAVLGAVGGSEAGAHKQSQIQNKAGREDGSSQIHTSYKNQVYFVCWYLWCETINIFFLLYYKN